MATDLPYPLGATGRISSKTLKLKTSNAAPALVTFTKIRNDTARVLKEFFNNDGSNANSNTYFNVANASNSWKANATYSVVKTQRDMSIVWSTGTNASNDAPLRFSSAFPNNAADNGTVFSPHIAKMYIQYVITHLCDAISKLVIDKASIADVQAKLDERFTQSKSAMLDVLKTPST
jgi:hypothetical protein